MVQKVVLILQTRFLLINIITHRNIFSRSDWCDFSVWTRTAPNIQLKWQSEAHCLGSHTHPTLDKSHQVSACKVWTPEQARDRPAATEDSGQPSGLSLELGSKGTLLFDKRPEFLRAVVLVNILVT